MNRSVKDIAKSLGTNKNVIYRIINKFGLEPVEDSGTASKLYSDESVQIIRKEYKSLQERHQTASDGVSGGQNESQYVTMLENQVRRYENEIDRLNDLISQKDQAIIELTDKLTKTIESGHLETLRYQELLAREQDTKLLLTAQSQTRFNLFRPSTWKRSKTVESENLTPLTDDETTGNK